jgi:DNA-binding NtrC family response regulator
MMIRWIGTPAPPRLPAGMKLSARADARALAQVVATRSGQKVPSAPGGPVPWIWCCEEMPSRAAVREAVLRGAYDVVSLRAPDGPARLSKRLRELCSGQPPPAGEPAFVARSPAARRLLEDIEQAAQTSQPVLLTGETGTGKELAARMLHSRSARAKGAFVPINCAAIPNELMEGELFGYAKGAFSGAVRESAGLVSAAEGGTVFLDEIDDTPHALQVKLLRVLEDRMVTRLGESVPRRVDFRLVAATNRNLREMVAAGQFGGDLYERLAVVAIELPPLRERMEDLPALVEHFVARFYAEEPLAAARGRVSSTTAEALEALAEYSWPGNIRELRNVLFGALVSKRGGDELLLSDLPQRLLRRGERPQGLVRTSEIARRMDAGQFNLRREVEELERAALAEALSRSGGRAAGAARLLGDVGRGRASDPGGTVRAMMRRLGFR